MQKNLILNGSPQKNGGTAALIRLFEAQLAGETIVIDTYTCGVSPCIDCRACWKQPGCVLQDPMQAHYECIDRADNVLVASPIYFAELTGPLLSWASRLQCLWTAQRFLHAPLLQEKQRFGGIALVDGGDGCSETAHAMGKRLLRIMGADYKGLVYFSGTDYTNPTTPQDHPEVTAQADALCRIFNRETRGPTL